MTGEERVTVGQILELLRELRDRDEHWRERMEAKTDKLAERIDLIAAELSTIPAQTQAAINACREERERLTAAAVADADQRRTVSRWFDTKRKVIGWVIATLSGLSALAWQLIEHLGGN